jgi:hypothetical protein
MQGLHQQANEPMLDADEVVVGEGDDEEPIVEEV